MKRLFTRRQKHTPLWRWVGVRMSALAVFTVVAIAFGMWLRFAIEDAIKLRQLPPDARHEMITLRVNPRANETKLWQLFARYYDVVDFLPGLANRDWWMLGALIAGSIPLILLGGLLASRPLSRQFSNVADAARRVSEGDFSARANVIPGAPDELASFAMDFNSMTTKLQQYEREVRESSVMLAHELRTPLNAAMGRVQGMLDQVFPNSDEQLRMVHRQLEQINRLVGDLHLLSLARAGQLVLERDAFPLEELISERVAWVAPQLQKAGIVPEIDAPKDIVAYGDRDRIGQVLSILIDNALRYASSGKSLSIGVGSSNAYFDVSVSDRGPGVEPALVPQMIDRFWRAEGSRARHWGGSGLGLSIASAICQAHGGTLEIANREQGGISVRMSLPRHN